MVWVILTRNFWGIFVRFALLLDFSFSFACTVTSACILNGIGQECPPTSIPHYP